MDICEFKNQIWDYTRKISENANNVFIPICEEQGVTMLQSRTLLELYFREIHTIGSLADCIYVAEANVSAMCKKLESQGLLRRNRDCQDERVVKVCLTDQGARLAQAIDQALNDKFCSISADSGANFPDIVMGLQRLNELLLKMSHAGPERGE